MYIVLIEHLLASKPSRIDSSVVALNVVIDSSVNGSVGVEADATSGIPIVNGKDSIKFM